MCLCVLTTSLYCAMFGVCYKNDVMDAVFGAIIDVVEMIYLEY